MAAWASRRATSASSLPSTYRDCSVTTRDATPALESAVSEIRSLARALASGANQGLVFLVIVGRFLLG
jgi:hypothetical protein